MLNVQPFLKNEKRKKGRSKEEKDKRKADREQKKKEKEGFLFCEVLNEVFIHLHLVNFNSVQGVSTVHLYICD